MKTIFLFLALCVSYSSYSQSSTNLDETLLWIKAKIESYPMCEQICYTAKVSYDITKKVITIEYTSNIGNKVVYIIPLKNINTYGYSYTKNFIFTVQTKGNDITRYDIGNDGSKTTKFDSAAYLVFDDKKFKEENLENRLIKAFNHACELAGGNAGKEPF